MRPSCKLTFSFIPAASSGGAYFELILVKNIWMEAYGYLSSLYLSIKIEKEKRELAKQYGMVRNEVMGGEIAEEMEKERRMFQLNMCEVQSWEGTAAA